MHAWTHTKHTHKAHRHTHTGTYAHTHAHTHAHMFTRTHTCAHAHTDVSAHAHMCQRRNTRTHTLWAYRVVVSMFDFHHSDRGLNPGCGSKISYCLRLHYSVAPLASV